MAQFFVLAGGQRCGTTWLYRLLDRHPGICMAKPVRPEPKYFLGPQVSRAEYVEKYFRDAQGRLCGEKSTSYYESEEVAQRIYDTLPGARIVLIFRNPVERAISNYHFSRENGLETRTLEEVFLHQIPPPQASVRTSVDPFDYIGRGRYSCFLTAYQRVFGAEQVHAMNFENAVADYDEVGRLFEFLHVDKIPAPPDLHERVNHSFAGGQASAEVRARLHEVYRSEIDTMSRHFDVTSWVN